MKLPGTPYSRRNQRAKDAGFKSYADQRNAQARDKGYLSYWDERTAPESIKMRGTAWRKAIRKNPETEKITSKVLAQGQQLMRDKKFAEAEALARKKGVRKRRRWPAVSVFYYHFD